MRFSDPAAEMAFRSSSDPETVRMLLSGVLLGFTAQLVAYGPQLLHEIRRADDPFVWASHDPRTLFFATAALNQSVAVVTFAACLAYTRYHRLKFLNWECVAVAISVIVILSRFPMSAWHAARMFGKSPTSVWSRETGTGEMLALLDVIAALVGVGIYIPIRTCVFWIVPLLSVLSYAVIIVTVGSPIPGGSLQATVYLFLINIILFRGVCRHERHRRDTWLARQEVQEQDSVAHALHAMAGTLCDIIIHLDVNWRVVKSSVVHDAFFGRPMEGCEFSALMADEDQHNFHELLKRAAASQGLESMPVRLQLPFSICTAQLSAIHVNGGLSHFLVGLSQGEHEPRAPGNQEVALEALHTIAEDQANLEPANQDPANLEPANQESRLGSDNKTSVVSTSFSDQVFKDIDRLALESSGEEEMTLRKTLQHIAEVGTREHWLVGTSEVALVPDTLLGRGGFGIVVLGQLRGSVVAVKIPKKCQRVGDAIKKLSSFCNELRVHRHLRHKNLVAFHAACIEPSSGDLALIYEFVDGVRMDVYVQKNLTPGGDALVRLKLLIDVCFALTYLHQNEPPIVHGDLKTTNVMVEELRSGARAKLLDFGLARLLTKGAKPLGGTRGWLAPELVTQGAARPRPQPSADVFSFGLLAYAVMSGQRCPGSRKPLESAWAQDMPFREQCRKLCKDCMRGNPVDRPAMPEMVERLLAWCGPASMDDLLAQCREIAGMFFAESLGWEQGLERLASIAGAEESARPAEGMGQADQPEDEGQNDGDLPFKTNIQAL